MSKNNSYSTLSPFLNLPIVVNTNVILLEFNTSGVGAASTIVTTGVTVAIGIKHLRCLVLPWYKQWLVGTQTNCYWQSIMSGTRFCIYVGM
jgi:hypothetical protein